MKHEFHRPDLEAQDNVAALTELDIDLKRIIDANGVILDVGASRGEFAKNILRMNIADTKIFCFEPLENAYEDLRLLSQSYNSITPIKRAVALKNGEATFFVTAGDMGSSLLEPLPDQPSQWLTFEKKISVETIRLDDFIKNELGDTGGGVSLLKSDAQGADLNVILSAGDYLNPKFIKSVLVEINFTDFYHGQQNYYDIFSLLDSAGYRMARMYPHRAHDEWLWWADVLFIGKK